MGCGGPNHDSNEVISCVRSKYASELLNAAAKVPPLPAQAKVQATFNPTFDNRTVFPNYKELSLSGNFATISLLAGHTDYDHGWYRLAGYAAKLNSTDARLNNFTKLAFACPTAHTTKY